MQPALSTAWRWTAAGLPAAGERFAAPVGDEAAVLPLAAQFDAAKPRRNRCPPMAA